ncbi:MAG: bifunctional phosphoserine phosphatase/homoserine phosphotransferase ThrH [Propionibacteriaceae bacterium]|jgi:phosphoserine/homoserine phosphotransferase|nr:bifunctional phosphoserine phosphatase/homoserine phosphotransferase ThrH [Propionibacteriaceae bacterium]
MGMEIMCLDLEGVLVPEIWIKVAEATGIDGLRVTTREMSDYDELMGYRLRLLDEHGLKLPDLQRVIAGMRPLDGAVEFLAWLKRHFQVVILSDTFYDFAAPLMERLDHPALFAHNLEVAVDGRVVGYSIRLADQKRAAVHAFQSLNFQVFAAGDSYNDTAMLMAADRGFLFNPPPNVVDDFPGLPVVTTYDGLRDHLIAASSRRLG